MKQTNVSGHLQQALDHAKLSIHELIKGKLSPYLITPQAITSSLHQIQSFMDKKYPKFTIIHKDPFYYFTYGDLLCARVHSTLFLTLKVPISPFKQPLLLYDIYSIPVPINSSTSHATTLMDIPHYYEFFFYPKSHSTIFGDTTYQQYLDLKVPNFKIFNQLFSHFVTADQNQHLNLKKMAELAQKDATVFQSLAESMLNGQIDFAVTSFPNTSGIIAIIASALELICMLYCI